MVSYAQSPAMKIISWQMRTGNMANRKNGEWLALNNELVYYDYIGFFVIEKES